MPIRACMRLQFQKGNDSAFCACECLTAMHASRRLLSQERLRLCTCKCLTGGRGAQVALRELISNASDALDKVQSYACSCSDPASHLLCRCMQLHSSSLQVLALGP